MAKINQNSIQEPTDEELAIYNQFIHDLSDDQIDYFANEYYDLVAKDGANMSFPRFLIDKIIRPIREGDTLKIATEDGLTHMFCILRKEIEGRDYLAMCKVDEETETLLHEEVYIFFVDGKDNVGTEIIDLLPSGEEANKILKAMEEALDAKPSKEEVVRDKKQE